MLALVVALGNRDNNTGMSTASGGSAIPDQES
jgi:hypothetical protein